MATQLAQKKKKKMEGTLASVHVLERSVAVLGALIC